MMMRVASRHLGVRFMRLAKLLDTKISHLEKIADLSPPLGSSSDPCIVVDRAKKRVRDEDGIQEIKNILKEMKLTQKGDTKTLALTDLDDNTRMYNFYRQTYYRPIIHVCKPDTIGSGRKKTDPLITHIEISPHTQFRMDVRGITVHQVEEALRNYQASSFSKRDELEKAFKAEQTEKLVQRIINEGIEHDMDLSHPYVNRLIKEALGLISVTEEQKKKKIVEELGYKLEDIDPSQEEYEWVPDYITEQLEKMKEEEEEELDRYTLNKIMSDMRKEKQIRHTYNGLFVAFIPKSRGEGQTVSLKTVYYVGKPDDKIECP